MASVKNKTGKDSPRKDEEEERFLDTKDEQDETVPEGKGTTISLKSSPKSDGDDAAGTALLRDRVGGGIRERDIDKEEKRLSTPSMRSRSSRISGGGGGGGGCGDGPPGVMIGLRGAMNKGRVYTEGWRLSKSSVSSIYHSAQDIADLMSESYYSDASEPASPFRSYHSIQESYYDTDRDDIFSSPHGSMNLQQINKKVRVALIPFLRLYAHLLQTSP
jgi:hypothetical protein